MERDDKGREVERDAGRALVGLPDQEGLRGAGFVAGLARGFELGVLEAGRQACVDLVVPATADAPSRFPVLADHLARHLVGRRCLPPARLEVQRARFARGPISDLHGPVVIDGGGAGDDADDGAGDFLPRVELLAAGCGAEFEKPGAEWVDIEGFAVEFGFDGRFTLCAWLARGHRPSGDSIL